MTLPDELKEEVDRKKLKAVDETMKTAIISEINNMEEGLTRIRRWVGLL